MTTRDIVAFAALAWNIATLQAQSQSRIYNTFRQYRGETRVETQIHIRDGSLQLITGEPAELYRAQLTYHEQQTIPASHYNTTASTLSFEFPTISHERQFSIEITAANFGNRSRRHSQHTDLRSSATVALSPKIEAPLTLSLDNADVDFHGLRTPSIEITTTGETSIQFSEPNGLSCRQLTVSGGGVRLSIRKLGNSGCEKIKFEGGVGEVTLDFSGEWRSSTDVRAMIVAGQLTLRLPPELGVQIDESTMLVDLDMKNFIKDGDRYRSTNYATAKRHLNIDVSAVVSAVAVEWLPR